MCLSKPAHAGIVLFTVVKLFNSVRKQQRELEEKLESVSEGKKAKGVFLSRCFFCGRRQRARRLSHGTACLSGR